MVGSNSKGSKKSRLVVRKPSRNHEGYVIAVETTRGSSLQLEINDRGANGYELRYCEAIYDAAYGEPREKKSRLHRESNHSRADRYEERYEKNYDAPYEEPREKESSSHRRHRSSSSEELEWTVAMQRAKPNFWCGFTLYMRYHPGCYSMEEYLHAAFEGPIKKRWLEDVADDVVNGVMEFCHINGFSRMDTIRYMHTYPKLMAKQ